jgi:hypothetical protein
MKRTEQDLLWWLIEDRRSMSDLLAMTSSRLNAWIRQHGGTKDHLDAACDICNALTDRRYQALRAAQASNLVSLRP